MTLSKTLLCALVAAGSFAAMPAVLAADKVAADDKGMTLYIFDKDKGDQSACYDDCATNWPPYLVQAGEKKEKDWGQSKRKDGAMQWTYDGHPMYFYIEDKAPGDMKGEGKGGVWHTIK